MGIGTMAKKYKITLTEEQMRIVQKCTEFYMRTMWGQSSHFTDELLEQVVGTAKHDDKNFDRYIWTKNAVNEIMVSVFRIAFNSYYGVPEEKTEDSMIAECLWDSVRFARGLSRWDSPFQIGGEPCPKIEVIDDEADK